MFARIVRCYDTTGRICGSRSVVPALVTVALLVMLAVCGAALLIMPALIILGR